MLFLIKKYCSQSQCPVYFKSYLCCKTCDNEMCEDGCGYEEYEECEYQIDNEEDIVER